jgi:hypothetical protein
LFVSLNKPVKPITLASTTAEVPGVKFIIQKRGNILKILGQNLKGGKEFIIFESREI